MAGDSSGSEGMAGDSNAMVEAASPFNSTLCNPNSQIKDYVVIITLICISFGDSVETYIPGAITQPVSCDLGLTTEKEIWLGVALYTALFIFSFLHSAVERWLGLRRLILGALYLGVIFTVLCAIVPNYWTLVAARFLLGGTIVTLYTAIAIYLTLVVQTRKLVLFGFAAISGANCIGGGWVGVLAYLCLEKVGWRLFSLLTSLPFFLIPITVLHLYLHDDPDRSESYEPLAEDDSGKQGRMYLFLGVSALCNLLKTAFTAGVILLVPSIIRQFNLFAGTPSVYSCGEIHGAQFLWLTVLFGVSYGVGLLLYAITKAYIRLVVVLIGTCLTFSGAILAMPFLTDNLEALMGLLGVVQVFSTVYGIHLYAIQFDREVIGERYLALSGMLYHASWYGGVLLGNVMSISIHYVTVLRVFPFFALAVIILTILMLLFFPSNTAVQVW